MTILAVVPARVSAGPIGLLMVLLMLIATVFLIRNMSSRLKKLPDEFPPPPQDDAEREPGPDQPRQP